MGKNLRVKVGTTLNLCYCFYLFSNSQLLAKPEMFCLGVMAALGRKCDTTQRQTVGHYVLLADYGQ